MKKVCVVVTARPSYSRIRSALFALKKYEDIDILKEILGKHYSGMEEPEELNALRIFARNVSPFALMEFAMTDEQYNEAQDRITNYFFYNDDDTYSYSDLELLIEQQDDNYLTYLYAKTKIDCILESSVTKVANNTTGRKIAMAN